MSIEEKVQQYIATLTEEVGKASSAKEQNQAVTFFGKGVHLFLRLVTEVAPEEVEQLAAALGEVHDPKKSDATVKYLTAVSAQFGKVTGTDRSAGDEVAEKLSFALGAGFLEGDQAERAERLIAAWKETAPRRRGRPAGSTNVGTPLTKRLSIKCDEHPNWSATEGTTENSLRWAAIKHCEKEHGHKPARGEPTHQGITEAIKKVNSGEAVNAQGGGFIVVPAAAS